MRGPVQRGRGQVVRLYRECVVEDSRGNRVVMVDEKNPHEIRVWVSPGRSSHAELVGQQDIDIIRIGTSANLAGVGSRSRVLWNGEWYDVITPPAYHHGTPHTRHWTIDIRRRPSG